MLNFLNKINILHNCPQRQRGAALMVMLVIIIIGSAAFLVSALSRGRLQIERDRITTNALAQAKEALIGYAVRDSNRPGNLPCPDVNDDGKLTSTIDFNGSNCTSTIGRLPWKTLGLPELLDGAGEHLWYAVSTPFWSTQSSAINSDTAGTITVRDSTGNILNNGCSISGLPNCPNPGALDAAFGTGAVAVIIAPGEVLTRQGSSTAQVRSSTGINIASNYLDIFSNGLNTFDNASIIEGSSIKGFIKGRILDNNGVLYVNDQLLVVTQDSIMQAVQKRVANEVKNCLNEYASNPQNSGRYPWPAKLDPTTAVSYSDSSGILFGRIPNTLFTNTCLDSGGYHNGHLGDNCSNTPSAGMNNTWTGACTIISNSGWWPNWKEMVFYGLADAYKPKNPPSSAASCSAMTPCIAVNPPSATADKKFVVIAAGKKMTGQSRNTNSDKGTLSNYLEGINATGATPFEQLPNSPSFNDTVVFQ